MVNHDILCQFVVFFIFVNRIKSLRLQLSIELVLDSQNKQRDKLV